MTVRQAGMEDESGIQVAPRARQDDIVINEIGDELLIYDQRQHHIHQLNRASAAIWRLADGRRSLDQLAVEATKTLGEPVDPDGVRLALTKLDGAGLLAGPLGERLRARRTSRRDVLRKAAAGTAVAMPMIVSMTVPAAAQIANSQDPPPQVCVPEGGVCTDKNQCCLEYSECVFWSTGSFKECHRSCVPTGGVCDSTAECCDSTNDCYLNGAGAKVCQPPPACLTEGATCTVSNQNACCDGLRCDAWVSWKCVPVSS